MHKQRVEARFGCPMSAVFDAVARELGAGRWCAADETVPLLPRTGLRFGYRHDRRLYCGEVLECLRPVSIVIVERYRGPAGSIAARQRWRVDSLDSETLLTGELRFEPNRFARLQLRFWKSYFASRARRTCSRVQTRLRAEAAEPLPLSRAGPGPGDFKAE
ncbi:MAG: hypothetical protein PVG24_01245 [Gammaproteobacteria bacterium]|jgi:hypothetical protein